MRRSKCFNITVILNVLIIISIWCYFTFSIKKIILPLNVHHFRLSNKFAAIFNINLTSQITNYTYLHFESNIGEVCPTSPFNSSLKIILVWTGAETGTFYSLRSGQKTFYERKCKVKTCYVYRGQCRFNNILQYDAIVFDGPYLSFHKDHPLPHARSPRQKYIFATEEPSAIYGIRDERLNNFFNLSWTYKLDSDLPFKYLIVRNSKGEIIGPKPEMHWLNVSEMMPIDDIVKQMLNEKTKLAAWLVSNCGAHSRRHIFVKELMKELKKLNPKMKIDIFGACGLKKCPRVFMPNCLRNIRKNYYFYLAFENSFCEDYVSEKLLHPLQHLTVPVVFGGANYTRFMPDGMYLNARTLGPANLAKRMIEIVSDKELYYSFFKWRNHYSYDYLGASPESDGYCQMCAALNDDNYTTKTTVIENFIEWWNVPNLNSGLDRPPSSILVYIFIHLSVVIYCNLIY